jgi:hypothetical protein
MLPDATPLVGLRIRMKRTIDTPCCGCGETVVAIGPGAGPHVASLHCAACERHRGWLPKALTEFLTETIRRFGPLRDGVTISNPAAAPLGATVAATNLRHHNEPTT